MYYDCGHRTCSFGGEVSDLATRCPDCLGQLRWRLLVGDFIPAPDTQRAGAGTLPSPFRGTLFPHLKTFRDGVRRGHEFELVPPNQTNGMIYTVTSISQEGELVSEHKPLQIND